jgi:lipoate-protein ligase A
VKLYHLGHVPWLDSQLLYHALPRVGGEGLFILAPAQPYVCIGYHQDLAQEVDVAYCRERGIPIFRREVGGGAVFLDGKQIFYQVVLHKGNPLAQGDKAKFYERMLQPVAEAYIDLGVLARYRPVNDVITLEGRKISGTGAAEIGDYIILVGNLIADFDYETMSHVLRVPDEKYRDKVFKSMHENLTTLVRELGYEPSWDEMVTPLLQRYGEVLGDLEPAELPRSVYEVARSLESTFLSEEWLARGLRSGSGKQRPGREVKIASGVNVIQRMFKAPGGLLRATCEVRDGILADVSLSGDFFSYPQEAIGELEAALAGAPLSGLGETLARYYATHAIDTPGVTPNDWLRVLGG